VQPRNFYLDTQARQFVVGPNSTIAATGAGVVFGGDLEAVNLFALAPTGNSAAPYTYESMAAATVRAAVGLVGATPAALQLTWSPLATGITVGVTTLQTGSGTAPEVQRIDIEGGPVAGGFALQIPARNASVSSVTAGVFVCTVNHGLFDTQPVTLTAFTISTGFANGSTYFVRDRSDKTFRIAESPAGAALTPVVTSGGGTAEAPAVTTGQLAYNASPADVQAAFVAAGVAIGTAPQIIVTGTSGTQYTVAFSGAMTGINLSDLVVLANSLEGAAGLTSSLDFDTAEAAALVAGGAASAIFEVEITQGGFVNTYQLPVTVAPTVLS
jgi:hypothetical protein